MVVFFLGVRDTFTGMEKQLQLVWRMQLEKVTDEVKPRQKRWIRPLST